jgi:RNA polymerase sigma-70 factor (ECF subfamily)
MLGTVMDAEDMVQETFLRWQQVPEQDVHSPKAFLSSIITRLCIDRLRSARVQREQYVGMWLPEPLVTQQVDDPAKMVELADSLSTAFLLLLETLSPTERAVFLLREIFDYDYDEIGQIVHKSPVNCRQIVRRARQTLAAKRPRFSPSPQQQEQLVTQFLHACTKGDMQGLLSLLAEDITVYSDGGGKVQAARTHIHGPALVIRFLLGISSKQTPNYSVRVTNINGQTGILRYRDGLPQSAITFDIADERIQAIYIVVNPDKLTRIHSEQTN